MANKLGVCSDHLIVITVRTLTKFVSTVTSLIFTNIFAESVFNLIQTSPTLLKLCSV